MKTILITFAIIAVATAAPIEEETMTMGDVVQIVRSSQVFEADGSYKFSFETADGSIREETGTIVNPGKEDAYVARAGLYRFTNPSGEVVEVRYTADTKGYVPRGTHIPTVPDVVVPTMPDVVVSTMPDVVVPTVSEVVVPTVSDVLAPTEPEVVVPTVTEVVVPTVSDAVPPTVPDMVLRVPAM